ncbi:hypothetical protein K438DRAFT_327094 [Mycena galopus ATCC 62051]|nr:hypothetical protein K438DRAFT_327094 [Mycena galopus ATCC 62051]
MILLLSHASAELHDRDPLELEHNGAISHRAVTTPRGAVSNFNLLGSLGCYYMRLHNTPGRCHWRLHRPSSVKRRVRISGSLSGCQERVEKTRPSATRFQNISGSLLECPNRQNSWTRSRMFFFLVGASICDFTAHQSSVPVWFHRPSSVKRRSGLRGLQVQMRDGSRFVLDPCYSGRSAERMESDTPPFSSWTQAQVHTGKFARYTH